ncbi:MAG TPA: FAD-dependent oxidoreductase [Halanaerobiales bacterium]|nr:FAD-dependent oxidoreductase [Halanaerobiales bacterium]
MSEDKKSIFSPTVTFKNLFKKPETVKYPKNSKETAKRYRGFHINDLDKCIGCGTCAEICDNKAIDMVQLADVKTELGQRDERPKIDYGRCCWCGLCVDVCTTGSLEFTQDYTYIDKDPDTFAYIPDHRNINKVEFEVGYERDDVSELLDLDRVEMEELDPEKRVDSFVEIVQGFSKEQAEKEASRCVECDICTEACPASMNIPEYIRGIFDEDLDESLKQIYEDNPLPEVCGRVCTHKCETICSIGHRGEPISIRWLKRYAVDNVDSAEYQKVLGTEKIDQIDKEVAIIGAGPAGLSAAHYLRLMGYQITVYESEEKAGGMMRYGIPEYRLPYEQLDKDINYIKELGVEFVFNTRVGEDISMQEIEDNYDAVFAATGLHNGRSTRIPGTEHNNVYQAIYLLKQITKGKEVPVTERIVVIGGGNVAMDIARSLARIQKQEFGDVDVLVTSLETEDIMPADQEEIEEAREEGVRFEPGRGPKEIVVNEDGSISQLCTNCCVSVFDDERNFNPSFDNDDIKNFDCDMVVEAIGQGGDNSYIDDNYDIEYEGPRIKVDEEQQTSLPWLFAGGDIVQGPDVITGIKTGHDAAVGIDKYLRGEK